MSFLNCKIAGFGIPQSEYSKEDRKRGDPKFVMSRSSLCDVLECPHKWINTTEDQASSEMEWGTIIDEMLLTDGTTPPEFVVTPQFYTDNHGIEKPFNFNSAKCQEWIALQNGKLIVKHAIHEKAQLAVLRLKNHPGVQPILEASKFQVMLTGFYSIAGLKIPIKALIDILPNQKSEWSNWIIDLKTSQSAMPSKWGRKVYDLEYHVQSAFYLDFYNAATKEERNTFAHIVQESEEPYEASKQLLDESFIEIGRAKYQQAIELYAHCLKSNHWPTYDELDGGMRIRGCNVITPESWMIMRSGITINA